jgi:ABC-type transport system substrate-binding protein
MPYQWPSKNQWRQFFKVLNKEEKTSFFIFLFLFLGSLGFLLTNFYFEKTEIAPAVGGIYIEGVVGSPLFINPIYADASDIDRDLTQLIFSGLMKYDSEGNIQKDLAESYKILEDGKVYDFSLKENVVWQDSQPLTADDVVFTIETIQNPEVKSPLRPVWLGVEVEKISNYRVRFTLTNESSVFLENCTLKIIPKHIWENTSPQNFRLTRKNLNPVGSGPYKLENLVQNNKEEIVSLDLVRNELYFDKGPNISKISFQFFKSEEELISNYEKGKIKGFSLNSIENVPECSSAESQSGKCLDGNIHSFSLPRYFAVFFNPEESEILEEKDIRMALNYGTDKNEILDKAFYGHAKNVYSPILPDIYNFKEPSVTYEYNPEKAKEILEENGFIMQESGFREKFVEKNLAFTFKNNLTVGSQGEEVTELQKCLAKDPEVYPEAKITGYFGSQTKEAVIKFQEKYSDDILAPIGLTKGTGDVKPMTREKLNEICFEKPEENIPLKISLLTVDQPVPEKVTEILKEQWKRLGVDVEIKTLDINTIEREILRKRDFESLLFGEVLGLIPDPFPFWHSSQKGELGLNLANYENKESDKLLENNRKSLDETEREKNLEEFQDILLEDCPAIFLYNPDYRYFVSEEVKGINSGIIIDPSKRFAEVEDWYIKTKRVWK